MGRIEQVKAVDPDYASGLLGGFLIVVHSRFQVWLYV